MTRTRADVRPPRRRSIATVLAVQALSVVLVLGWFASGGSTAPDAGLQQIGLLMLHERVPGVHAVDGRPTMVVAAGQGCPDGGPPTLSDRFGLVVSGDPELARRLALPRAAQACEPGYVLLDAGSTIRYRSYDPGWQQHGFEQEVLLEAMEQGHQR